MKCFCQSLKEITCRMLFFSSPYSTFGGLCLGAMSKTDCIKQIASVSFESGLGRGLKKAVVYFTRSGTSILIPFDCGGTLWGEGILVGWRHERNIFFESDTYVEILFWFSHLRWFIHLHCSTLASVAINRSCKCSTNNKLGLDPWQLALVGCSPNSKCNVINLSHTRQQPDTASDKQDKNVFKSL